MGLNERKISADKGTTGFLFGHYDDLIGSEATHSEVFSEDWLLWEKNQIRIRFFCPHCAAKSNSATFSLHIWDSSSAHIPLLNYVKMTSFQFGHIVLVLLQHGVS